MGGHPAAAAAASSRGSSSSSSSSRQHRGQRRGQGGGPAPQLSHGNPPGGGCVAAWRPQACAPAQRTGLGVWRCRTPCAQGAAHPFAPRGGCMAFVLFPVCTFDPWPSSARRRQPRRVRVCVCRPTQQPSSSCTHHCHPTGAPACLPSRADGTGLAAALLRLLQHSQLGSTMPRAHPRQQRAAHNRAGSSMGVVASAAPQHT